MRRSPAYIETPQIRLPPAVNISHQNIRRVHSEHTQNFIYPSLKCKWQIHTKLLAPNDLISLSYRTQYCVWNDNVYYELKKNRLKYLSATWPVLEDFFGPSQGIAIATQWMSILTRAKQMKSLDRNERITLRQLTRIYHWFRSVQSHFVISKLILSVHVINQKCVIFIFQIKIFDEMRDSYNVSKIGLIFSALSKSACGGLVRQVRHFVQPW